MRTWWDEVWSRWGDVVGTSLVALPLCVAAVVVLVGVRRRRGVGTGPAWRLAVAEVVLVAGTVPWVWMILTPTASAGAGVRRVAVPVTDLVATLSGPRGEAVVQVGGNLLVLAALGGALPVRRHLGGTTAAVLGRVAVVAGASSCLVELLQWALDLGRVTSLDDVLLNTLGAVLAATATRRWWRGARAQGAAG